MVSSLEFADMVDALLEKSGFDAAEVARCIDRQVEGGFDRANLTRWKKGQTKKPRQDYIEAFAHCLGLSKAESNSLLWAAGYLVEGERTAILLLRQMKATEERLATNKNEKQQLYENLPHRFGTFLGRQEEIDRVLEGLASRELVTYIEGLGGIGKTSLALEVARYALAGSEARLYQPFQAVAWVSAKDKLEQKRWLIETLDTVARVLGYPSITQLSLDQKQIELDSLLRTYRTLIIVDNFETVEDPELVTWIQRVPEPSKVLITSRYSSLRHGWNIHLQGLPQPDALELIYKRAHQLGLKRIMAMREDHLFPLVQVTEGNPKAIEIALGFVKGGILSLSEVVKHLENASQTMGDVFNDLFVRAWEALTPDAQSLLLVMTFFVESARKEALGASAGLANRDLDMALGQLVDMSLLN